MNNLYEFAEYWQPTESRCREINETFIQKVNETPELKELRDFVEQHSYGMGERSFYWMWKLILQELPELPRLLEIGVHRGQTLALWHVLDPDAYVWGISPFNGLEVGEKRDYKQDVRYLLSRFCDDKALTRTMLFEGLSDESDTIEFAAEAFAIMPLDVLYIDGGHSYETTRSDIINYSPLVRPGGFMVIDDCANIFPHPFGYFSGIESVCRAVDSLLPPRTENAEWEHLGAVVHNRIWRKK